VVLARGDGSLDRDELSSAARDVHQARGRTAGHGPHHCRRNLDARAQEIVAALRTDQLAAPPAITAAGRASKFARVHLHSVIACSYRVDDGEAASVVHDEDLAYAIAGKGGDALRFHH
jgi:hypothetical protein